ncbi:MAG: type I-U CRISPR-associated protein Csb2 [Bryobacteraceae bacterium]|nr:type I-U CRISPR-associated protein Csb2 [Bryobacteraceae bacterium]MDW8376515.1 type I-U CRISPR-associated protein Csb2 [Bryobacterales bacterium]
MRKKHPGDFASKGEGEQPRQAPASACLSPLAAPCRSAANWSALGGHEPARENAREQTPCGPFDQMVIFRLPAWAHFPIESALRLTALLRNALMAIADGFNRLTPFLHGHAPLCEPPLPHVAFAALADVAHAKATGKIEGLAVILPRHHSLVEHRNFMQLLDRLEELRSADLPMPLALQRESGRARAPAHLALHPETWRRRSQLWATVTPVVLDRYPKRKLPPEKIVRESIQRAGLPAPNTVLCSPYSQLAAVPPAGQFLLRRKPDEPRKWAVHACIEFHEPVRGPLLLGSGRFFGLGLFKPLEASQRQVDDDSSRLPSGSGP